MTVRAMKAGAVEFLSKPFRDQDLLDAVRPGSTGSARRETDKAVDRLQSRFAAHPREQEVMPLVRGA